MVHKYKGSIHKRRGSMMVEACLILPICLFLMMAMACFFCFLQLEECLLYSAFGQMKQCSTEMSLSYPLAKTSRLYLEHQIMNHTLEAMGEEQSEWIQLVGVSSDSLFFTEDQWEETDDIHCRIHCRWNVGSNDSMGYFSDEIYITGRRFCGEDSQSVWIFPNWGECYHEENCYVTGGERRRTLETVAQEQGYRPCQICLKGEGNGENLGPWRAEDLQGNGSGTFREENLCI